VIAGPIVAGAATYAVLGGFGDEDASDEPAVDDGGAASGEESETGEDTDLDSGGASPADDEDDRSGGER